MVPSLPSVPRNRRVNEPFSSGNAAFIRRAVALFAIGNESLMVDGRVTGGSGSGPGGPLHAGIATARMIDRTCKERVAMWSVGKSKNGAVIIERSLTVATPRVRVQVSAVRVGRTRQDVAG